MPHKVHPTIFRLGITTNWKTRWFSKKDYRNHLKRQIEIRGYLEKKLKKAALERIEIEGSGNTLKVIIHAARPGIIIGRGGVGVEELKRELGKKFGDKINIEVEIIERRKPEGSASLMAQNIAEQLERRLPFRRVMKRALDKIMAGEGVEGAKVALSGRLGGAEMSRREWLKKGKIPLQTLRANIDFAQTNAYTVYGVIGVKVWIYKGEVFEEESQKS